MLRQGRGVRASRHVGKIEAMSDQPLVEKPNSSCVGSCWRFAHERFKWLWPHGLKKFFENQKMNAFVLEGESQVAFKRSIRSVACRKDAPVC